MDRPRQQPARLKRLIDLLTGRPQVLVFLPAAFLAAYFLFGEAAMVALALAIPAAMTLSTLSARRPAWYRARDSETGLALRDEAEALLTAWLTDQDQTGRTPAGLVIGIDALAEATGRLGAAGTQKFMRQCAERLTLNCRDTDIVAAYGPGRFAIALSPMPRADLEAHIQICARLQAAMAEPFILEGARLHITISAGACMPGRAPARRGADMLHAAELALDEAMVAGPATIRSYAPDMARRAAQRSQLGHDLLRAFDNRQFQPWFSPQLSTDTGGLAGLSLTPRWEHPEHGTILPADFMHAIAEAGKMAALDEAMIEAGLRALQGWDRDGLNIPSLSLRLHSASLEDPQCAEKILWIADRFDITPARLRFALREDVLNQSKADVPRKTLTRLIDAGFPIELCAFGTGHATLADLRQYSVARVQIDASFIARVDRDRSQQDMVATILTMAEKLNITTLACGVGTTGEYAMLSQLGCHIVEGHAITGPLPAPDLPDWIANHRARLPRPPTIQAKPA